jgi:hypothetical protein
MATRRIAHASAAVAAVLLILPASAVGQQKSPRRPRLP